VGFANIYGPQRRQKKRGELPGMKKENNTKKEGRTAQDVGHVRTVISTPAETRMRKKNRGLRS